jgi:hypothetical protein
MPPGTCAPSADYNNLCFHEAVEKLSKNLRSLEDATKGLQRIAILAENLGNEDVKKGISITARCMAANASELGVQVIGISALYSLNFFSKDKLPATPCCCAKPSPLVVEHMWRESMIKVLMKALDVFAKFNSQLSRSNLTWVHASCYALVSSMYGDVDESRTAPEETLVNIPKNMRTHFQDDDATLLALKAITAAVRDERNAQNAYFLNGGECIQAIMAGMKAHEDNIEVQQCGCWALAFMCFRKMQIKKAMMRLRAPQQVLHIMQKHIKSSEVAMGACKFMFTMLSFSFEESMHDLLMQLGGVELLLSALDNHGDVSGVQVLACEALCYFLKSENKTCLEKWIVQGVYDKILKVMVANSTEELIQQSCCVTLCMLLSEYTLETQRDDLNAIRIRTIPVVLAAMSRFTHVANIIQHACQCVAFSCSLAAFATIIHKSDGINVVARAMKSHPNSLIVQYQIMTVINMACANHVRNQDACRRSGAIDAILHAIDYFKHDPRVLSMAREALAKISANHDVNTAYVKSKMTGKQASRLAKVTLEDFLPPESQLDPYLKHTLDMANGYLQATKEHDVAGQMAKAREKEKLAQKCVVCKKTAEEMGLKQLSKCSVCTIAPSYCGKECQKAHWAAHKNECKQNRKPAT